MSGAAIERAGPSGLLLGLAAFTTTGVSFVAWLFIALGSIFPWLWGTEWAYTGLALPAASFGALAAHSYRRPFYFWLGLAITLIPVVAYVLLEVTTPPPPPGWND